MQKRDFNFIEITRLHSYCSIHLPHICSAMSFRGYIWRTAFSYRSKYKDSKFRGSF